MSDKNLIGSGRLMFEDPDYDIWNPNPFIFEPNRSSIPTWDDSEIPTISEIWTYNYWIEKNYNSPSDSDMYIYFDPREFKPGEYNVPNIDGVGLDDREVKLNIYRKPKFPIIPKKGDIIISSPTQRELLYSKITNVLIPENEEDFISDIEVTPVKHRLISEKEIVKNNYFDGDSHHKFLHRRTNFVDNKVILNQPSAAHDKIEGVETSSEKFGYLIPDDLSPVQKENLSIILNILRDKSVLKSNQKEGGVGSVYL